MQSEPGDNRRAPEGMNDFWRIVGGALSLLVMCGVVIVLLVHWYRRSDDRQGLLLRWLVTAVTLAFLVFYVGPLISRFDMVAAFAGVPMAAVAGVLMAIVWAPSITDWAGRKVGQLMDGGDAEPEPQPCYSVAEAHRKAGRYSQAIAEVQRQLEVFPDHFGGWMLLAEIQAENIHDIDAAAATIEHLINQPGHTPKNIAFALTSLADWQLKHRRDIDMARASLQRIVDMFPDSPEAHFAHQRIAHLSPRSVGRDAVPPPPIPVPRTDDRLGLRADFTGFQLPAPDHAAKAVELIAQLEKYPLDNQAREDLAMLYAEGFHRLDLASEQLEQLIAQQHAPDKQIVRWLNLLADIQVAEGADPALARQTVQRIIDRYPGSPAAEQARRRLTTLGLECRARISTPPVALPSGASAPRNEDET